MTNATAELGMVGLGVMGRNLLLNMADHGHGVAGYDKDRRQVDALGHESRAHLVSAVGDLPNLVGGLRRPRTIMLLVPAGVIVDQVISEVEPLLDSGDLIIDGGNSRFADTDRRAQELEAKGIYYLGLGISGGEEGARHGPSLMAGGSREAYAKVQPLFEDISAHVDGEACAAYLGPRSAGHYVKMVHNGIEYGIMQAIAETYDIMRRGLGFGNDRLQEVYRRWNDTQLRGFLVEITADIFARCDERTDGRLIDHVLDQAKQKGTGAWTSEEAMQLQSPTPTIDAAVSARDLSALGTQRREVSRRYSATDTPFPGNPEAWVERIQDALYVTLILTFGQGLSLLRTASDKYWYNVSLEDVVRIWRGGCIIRTAILDDILTTCRRTPNLPTLLLDEQLGKRLAQRLGALREVVSQSARSGIPAPALMASLAYYEGLRSERLPANLIQAQRDCFGSHTYERIDAAGTFHTRWRNNPEDATSDGPAPHLHAKGANARRQDRHNPEEPLT